MLNLIVAAAVNLANLPAMQPGFAVGQDDYPPFALRYEHEGVVGFHVGVDAAGEPHDCFVTQSSTFAELDARTCEIVIGRMRFVPAHNPRGRAVAGVYDNRVRWQIAPNKPPAFVDSMVTTDVTFAPNGTVASCSIDSAGKRIANSTALCSQLLARSAAKLGAPQTDLLAARMTMGLTTGVDTVSLPEGLPGGARRVVWGVRISIAADGSISDCRPLPENTVTPGLPPICAAYPVGKIAVEAAPPGTERHGVYAFSISTKRR